MAFDKTTWERLTSARATRRVSAAAVYVVIWEEGRAHTVSQPGDLLAAGELDLALEVQLSSHISL